MLPPEDKDDILYLIRSLETEYSDQKAGYEEDEMFYEGMLDDYIDIPDAGYSITIPATGRAVIDEAVDNVNPVDILVNYQPRLNSRGQSTQELQAQSDMVRQFLRSWFNWNRKKASDIDPIRSFIKSLFMHGKAVMKIQVDWRFWPVITNEDLEEVNKLNTDELNELADRIETVRNSNTPLIFRNIHPKNILEDPTVGGKKLWVVEKYEMGLAEVLTWFKEAIDKEFGPEWWQRAMPNESYMLYEFWSGDWFEPNGKFHQGKHVVYINEDAIIEEANPYTDIPYTIKYSGFGVDYLNGSYEKKSVGLFSKQVKSLILAEARRVTQFDGIISQMAWPITFIPDDIEPDDISLSPGAINFIPKAVFENMGSIFHTPKILDAEYLNSLNFLGQQIQRGTIGPTLRGAGVPGTDSAAQYNAITSQSKLRIQPVQDAAEDAIADVMSKALMYIETVLKANVNVPVGDKLGSGKHQISPKDIGGKWDVVVEFKPNEEAIKERKLILSTNAKTAGMNPYDSYSIAGFENPEELIARDLVYQVLFLPEVVKGIAKKLAKEWGIDIDEVEVQTAMEEGVKQDAIQKFMNELFNGGDMRGQEAQQGQPGMPPQGALPPGNSNMTGAEMPPGRPPVPADPATSDIMSMIQGLGGQ